MLARKRRKVSKQGGAKESMEQTNLECASDSTQHEVDGRARDFPAQPTGTDNATAVEETSVASSVKNVHGSVHKKATAELEEAPKSAQRESAGGIPVTDTSVLEMLSNATEARRAEQSEYYKTAIFRIHIEGNEYSLLGAKFEIALSFDQNDANKGHARIITAKKYGWLRIVLARMEKRDLHICVGDDLVPYNAHEVYTGLELDHMDRHIYHSRSQIRKLLYTMQCEHLQITVSIDIAITFFRQTWCRAAILPQGVGAFIIARLLLDVFVTQLGTVKQFDLISLSVLLHNAEQLVLLCPTRGFCAAAKANLGDYDCVLEDFRGYLDALKLNMTKEGRQPRKISNVFVQASLVETWALSPGDSFAEHWEHDSQCVCATESGTSIIHTARLLADIGAGERLDRLHVEVEQLARTVLQRDYCKFLRLVSKLKVAARRLDRQFLDSHLFSKK